MLQTSVDSLPIKKLANRPRLQRSAQRRNEVYGQNDPTEMTRIYGTQE